MSDWLLVLANALATQLLSQVVSSSLTANLILPRLDPVSLLKLLEAFAAFERGDVELSHQTLEVYLKWMDDAWTALEGSGRQASRKPQGFKELDIALREDRRLLEDFEHRVPYQVREPVEKISKRVEELRERVLKALFPPQPLRQKGKDSAKPKQTLLWGKGYGA